MDLFDAIYDNMTVNYSRVEQLMGALNDKIKEGQASGEYVQILEALGEIANGMLENQSDFTEGFGDEEIKGSALDRLEEKRVSLNGALSELRSKQM